MPRSATIDRSAADAGPVVETCGGPDGLAQFRAAARRLWAAGVPPHRVHWHVTDLADDSDLFASAHPTGTVLDDAAPACNLTVPRAFADLAESVALNSDPGRFDLLYRLTWRLQHEPSLRHDPLDPDWLAAERLAHAVRHDLHKMKAFVRFRQVAATAAAPVHHVAWFEPRHHIVDEVAPFFVKRLANLTWAVLTPRRCVAWDGQRLTFGAGARREDAPPADAGEALWLTYYANIFNPARLKVAMMKKEMAPRYWHNLPEAALIAPLIAKAESRSAAMIAQEPSVPARAWQTRAVPVPVVAESADAPRCDGAAPAADRQRALAGTADAASRCTRCPLHAPATQTVFGQGPVDASLMVVGEQPGDQEDLSGRPFSGPSGALFDRALADLNVPRDSVYVTNAVKHFKFELRGLRRIHKTAAQQEAAACIDWLEREVTLVQPRAVLALGATAARALLGRPVAVMRERGQWFERADGVRVLVTLHPSALLRGGASQSPAEREAAYAAWRDDIGRAVGSADAPPPL